MLQCLSGLVQTKPKQCWQCDPQTRFSLPFSSPVLVVQHVYTFAEQRENRPKSPNIKPSLMSVYNEWVTSYTFPKMNGFHNHFACLHSHMQMRSIKSTILEKGPMTIRCDPQSYFFPTHTSLFQKTSNK